MNTRIKIIPILFICFQLPIIGFCHKTATFKNVSTCCDNFDDSSKNSSGGWSSHD